MNPFDLEIPDSWETPRLLIRGPREGDGAILYRAVRDSLPELAPWMSWAAHDPTHEEWDTDIREACELWATRKDLRLLIFDKFGEFVGSSGLHRIDWRVPKFEIVYWVHSARSGQGLMTEAVASIADFAFETLDALRLEIHCALPNHRSIALAKRVGFEHEATLRNYQRRGDQIHDVMIFTRLKFPT